MPIQPTNKCRWRSSSLRAWKAAGASLCFAVLAPAAAADAPRVVSLDYCADQYVLALADREQILALSHEARLPHSFHRDKTDGLPLVRANAEEILPLRPDVIVRHWEGAPRLLSFFRRQNIPVTTAAYGSDTEVVERNLLSFGNALSQQDRAQKLTNDMRAQLDEIRNRPPFNLTAAYITPGGVTAGKDTFIDAVIRMAGFETSAGKLDITGWPTIPIEKLILSPPDVVIGSFFDMSAHRDSNWSSARHAHVRKLLRETPTIYVPSAYLSCNGLFLAEAASLIRREAEVMGLAPPQVAERHRP